MSLEMMTTYEVKTKKIPDQQVAAVCTHTSMPTIGEDVAEGFSRVMAAIEIAGAKIAGPPFMVFHGRIDDVLGGDVEVCCPVAAQFLGVEEVYGAKIPGGTMASTVHRGSYDDVGPAYAAILTWMDEHGREPSGPPREYYLNDPETTKQEDLLTEIDFPIN